jgi:hypothetical protein
MVDLFAVLALLVGHGAGSLAGGLAGSLAFAAAALGSSLFEIGLVESLNVFHFDSSCVIYKMCRNCLRLL